MYKLFYFCGSITVFRSVFFPQTQKKNSLIMEIFFSNIFGETNCSPNNPNYSLRKAHTGKKNFFTQNFGYFNACFCSLALKPLLNSNQIKF